MKRIAAFPFPWRFLIFLGLLFLGISPLAVILWLTLPQPTRDLFLAIGLYLWLLLLLWQWGSRVRQQPRPFASYGLTADSLFYHDIGLGVLISVPALLGMLVVQGMLGWLEWQPIQLLPLLITLLSGLLLGFGVALVEELLFRGWLLNELEAEYPNRIAALGCALIFAIAHFLKPWDQILQSWPQFPGLVLAGVVLIWARWQRGSGLGLPMGLHGGWVWGIAVINSLGWVHYTGLVPEWVTGIGGNPLAGVSGLVLLTLTGMGVRCLPLKQRGR